MRQPVACIYCDGWVILRDDQPQAVRADRDQRRRLERKEDTVRLDTMILKPHQLLWLRIKRMAPYIFAIPTAFSIVVQIGVAIDPLNVTAVPGPEAGEENLLFWLVLSVAIVGSSGHRLLMALVCYVAAVAQTMVTVQWILGDSDYDALWLLQSETGLFHLAYIFGPLIIAVGWTLSQSREGLNHHVAKLKALPVMSWILAMVGIWVAWTGLQRPTVVDYAAQFEDKLAQIESSMQEVTQRIVQGQKAVPVSSQLLDPVPTYIRSAPERSNVEFFMLNPLIDGSWDKVYHWSGPRDFFFKGPLAKLLHSRRTNSNGPPTDVGPYEQAISAAWWVLYRVPNPCYRARDGVVEVWLVRAQDGTIVRSFDIACSNYETAMHDDILERLALLSSGSFE